MIADPTLMPKSEDSDFERVVAGFLAEGLHPRRGLTPEEYTALCRRAWDECHASPAFPFKALVDPLSSIESMLADRRDEYVHWRVARPARSRKRWEENRDLLHGSRSPQARPFRRFATGEKHPFARPSRASSSAGRILDNRSGPGTGASCTLAQHWIRWCDCIVAPRVNNLILGLRAASADKSPSA